MSRTQTILAAVLAVQLVLIVLVRAPWADRNAPADAHPLLPELAELDVTRIEIGDPDDPAVTLTRGADGWSIAQLDGFPATGSKIEGAIESLRDLTVRRPVATNPRYHGTFEVADDDPQGRVRVWGDGDDPAADLLLGSSPNYRALDVRRAGDDDVYEVEGLSAYDLSDDPAAWAEKTLFDVPRDAVVGVRLTNAAGEIALERGEEGWRLTAPPELAGVEPDADALETFLGAVSSLRLAEPAGPVDPAAQGLDAPVAVLELRTGGGSADEGGTLTVRVGGIVPEDENRRYVTRDGLGFAGQIWASSVTALLDRTAADLAGAGE